MPDAGRVIAGRARGIRLAGPGGDTRPMGDRVKQTLFAILEPDLPDARVLDLFAGSGAAGIEALSRRAGEVTFVERDPAAIRVIHANLDKAHLSGPGVRTVGTDVRRWLADGARAAESAVRHRHRRPAVQGRRADGVGPARPWSRWSGRADGSSPSTRRRPRRRPWSGC